MIDTLLSSASNDFKISHEEFTNIIDEKNIYENIKENIKQLTTEPSEEEKSTTLQKSFKILLMFKTLIKDEKRNLLFSM